MWQCLSLALLRHIHYTDDDSYLAKKFFLLIRCFDWEKLLSLYTSQTFFLCCFGLTLSILFSGFAFVELWRCCSASLSAKEAAVMEATGVLWTRVSLLWATLLPVEWVKSSPCSSSSLVAVLARDATGALIALLGLLRWGPRGLFSCC